MRNRLRRHFQPSRDGAHDPPFAFRKTPVLIERVGAHATSDNPRDRWPYLRVRALDHRRQDRPRAPRGGLSLQLVDHGYEAARDPVRAETDGAVSGGISEGSPAAPALR